MIPGIGVKIYGKDSLSSTLAGIQKNIGAFGRSAKQVGQTMSLGLSLPMGMFAYNTLKTAGDFEYGMNRVSAITGAVGDEFSLLETEAKHLGETTTFTAGQVTEGMQMLAQSGMNVDDIYSSIGTVLKGAQANMVDMGEAANIGAGLMRTFGYKGTDMIDVMDMLTKTSMSSMTNFSELAEAFVYAGPTAGAMGKTLKETSGVLGQLANGMMKGSMAGTSLRGMMAKLTAPTAEAVSIMQSLGITYDDILDEKGNMKSFVDVIAKFEKTGITAGEVLSIFGLRAGPGFQILLNRGSESLRELTERIGDFGGTTEKISNVQMAGFKGQMWALKSAFEGFEIAIAQSGILMWATKLGKIFTKFFRSMSKFHPMLLKVSFVFGLLVAAIGPLLMVLGMASIAIAAISWPIVGAIGFILAMVASLAVLLTWWDKVIDVVAEWGWIIGLLTGPVGWFIYASALIIKHWESIVGIITKAIKKFTQLGNLPLMKLFSSGQQFGVQQNLVDSNKLINTNERAEIDRLIAGTTKTNKSEVTLNINGLPKGATVESPDSNVITNFNRGNAFMYAGMGM